MFALIVCCIVGALAERLRGGYPPMGAPGSDRGAGRARAVRSVAFGLLVLGCGVPWWVALATAATLWLGMLNSHAHCWRVQNVGQAVDMMFLGIARGFMGVSPLLGWAAAVGDVTAVCIVVPLLPVLHAAAYGVAAHLDPHLPRRGGLLDDWNAYAELAWGAVLGSAIWGLTA